MWKLGTYTSGLVHIDIGGAGYDLAASGQDLRTSSTPTFSVVNADAFRVGAASTHSFESKTPVPGNVVGLAAWNTSTASNSDVGLFLQTQGSRTAGIILSRSSGLLEVQDSYSGVGTTRFTIDPLSGDTEIKGTVKTGTPAGGTARAWKLGQAASVSPTSPNRTIEVEVNGTTYYLHAKTTND